MAREAPRDRREFSLPGPSPHLPGVTWDRAQQGLPVGAPGRTRLPSESWVDTRGRRLPPSTYPTTLRDIGWRPQVCRRGDNSPHRPGPVTATPRASGVSRPAVSSAVNAARGPGLGRLGDSLATSSQPPADEHSLQVSDPTEGVPWPPVPPGVWPDLPGRVWRGRQARHGSVGGPQGPVALIRSNAGGEPHTALCLSRGDGVRTAVPRQTRATPSPPRKAPVFGIVAPGLPRQVVCLAAGQARQQAECGGEACALADSWCLTAGRTLTTAIQTDHGARNTRVR